jgi:hypothetical protein
MSHVPRARAQQVRYEDVIQPRETPEESAEREELVADIAAKEATHNRVACEKARRKLYSFKARVRSRVQGPPSKLRQEQIRDAVRRHRERKREAQGHQHPEYEHLFGSPSI